MKNLRSLSTIDLSTVRKIASTKISNASAIFERMLPFFSIKDILEVLGKCLPSKPTIYIRHDMELLHYDVQRCKPCHVTMPGIKDVV